MADKKKPLYDSWTNQQVHTNFPQNAVRVIGQPNMYVALWHHNGKPVMGKAWNDSGVVQSTGNDVKRELVCCESAAPIFWKEKGLLGNFKTDEQKAEFEESGRFCEVTDATTLGNMLVIVRNIGTGPPGCTCAQCAIENKASKQPLMVNDWGDFICGGPWPSDKPIMKALNRPLNTPRGPQDHFVSLWYRHGKPCMGRAWNSAGKIDASFVDGGREFTGHVIGSMQMLVEVPATAAGFDYCWLPYEQASRYMDKDFAPVHLSYIAPCVVQVDAFELLGSVNLKKERAEAAFDGKVMTLDGPKIRALKVLCRKDRDDTMVI